MNMLHNSEDAPKMMTLQLLRDITKNFSEKLGSGTYGEVFKGVHNGEDVAVKKLRQMPGLFDDLEQFKKEFKNLKKLRHENIVQLLGYCYETRHEYVELDNGREVFAENIYRALCFEYMHNGSLQDHLNDEYHGCDWQTRYKIIKGICKGLRYLHEELESPIYHLDLKPDNILLDKDMVPKLADFGLSKLVHNDQTQATLNSIGTRGYMPPEYIEENIVSKKFDIFSLGVIMIRILTGYEGYHKKAEMSSQEFIDLVLNNWRNRLQATLGCTSLEAECHQVKRCTEIALDCVKADRKQRPEIGAIIHQLNETEDLNEKLCIDKITPRAEESTASSSAETEAVLTLDVDNFDDAVAKHPFMVVVFYAPWCGHCKKLAPEYEKAAQSLSKHDPPIILAKVDANEEKNMPLATKYEVQGFPTLKIFRNQGKNVQEYKDPREAEGIVEYLKKQVGPASMEIKSSEDAATLIDDKKIYIVGVFTEFSGSEFTNFMEVAEKLRSDYDCGHTLHAKHLPRGDAAAERPLVRLLKPFDELVVDSKDFDVAALEKFIDASSTPRVVTFDKNPDNHPHLLKYFESSVSKAMLLLNFSTGPYEAFKSAYYGAADEFKDKEVKFLIGDIEASKGAFQYFGLKEEQAPLILIQDVDSKKFLKEQIEPDQIVSWLKDYFDGKLTPFRKSEPIPEANNEPVKVVVADSLDDVVLKSGKNVLIEFYAPWCGHCKKLAPILEEAATTLQSDEDVVIAKMDATANDVPSEFDIQGYPTMYFVTPSGKLISYDSDRTADHIVDFIKENKEAVNDR